MEKEKLIAEEIEKIIVHLKAISDVLKGTNETPAAAEDKPKEEKKTLKLEDVRGFLAEISRDGHTAEVRALLEKYGANKLSAVDPSKYGDLLKDAKEIKDGK